MKVGSVVRLKSGGPDMTVTKFRDDGGLPLVSVIWFAKNNGRSQFNAAADLPASSFVSADEDKPSVSFNEVNQEVERVMNRPQGATPGVDPWNDGPYGRVSRK